MSTDLFGGGPQTCLIMYVYRERFCRSQHVGHNMAAALGLHDRLLCACIIRSTVPACTQRLR